MQIISQGSKCIQEKINFINNEPTSFKKWNRYFDKDLDWVRIIEVCHRTSHECKLKWLQYRIIHRNIPTNRYLYLRNVIEDNMCSFCHREEESIDHFFWSCDFVKEFWLDLQAWLNEKCVNIVGLVFFRRICNVWHKRKHVY